MKRVIHVCLGDEGRYIGELRYDRQGARENAAFAYSSEWLAATDRFAIDPAKRSIKNPIPSIYAIVWATIFIAVFGIQVSYAKDIKYTEYDIISNGFPPLLIIPSALESSSGVLNKPTYTSLPWL